MGQLLDTDVSLAGVRRRIASLSRRRPIAISETSAKPAQLRLGEESGTRRKRHVQHAAFRSEMDRCAAAERTCVSCRLVPRHPNAGGRDKLPCTHPPLRAINYGSSCSGGLAPVPRAGFGIEPQLSLFMQQQLGVGPVGEHWNLHARPLAAVRRETAPRVCPCCRRTSRSAHRRCPASTDTDSSAASCRRILDFVRRVARAIARKAVFQDEGGDSAALRVGICC